MAAPVGQALTQAGPPSMPEHISHFIAFLGRSIFGSAFLYDHFLLGSPGPGPKPSIIQLSNPGFLGGSASIRMTP